MTAVPAPYDLGRKANRRWLGICLAFLFLIATWLATAIHEGGHALVHWMNGDTIYGFYFTPFAGQVLALYPARPTALTGLEDLAGILVTQITFFLLVGLRLAFRRTIPFVFDALYQMLLVMLAVDALYLAFSGPLHVADVYDATRSLGWSPYIFVVPGLVLCYVNYKLLRRLFRDWAQRWFADTATGSRWMVIRWCVATWFLTTVVYWSVYPLKWPSP